MSLPVYLRICLGVLFVTFFCSALRNYALFQISLATALTLGGIGPIYALPLVYLVKNERVTPRAVIFTFVSVAGVAVLCLFGVVPVDPSSSPAFSESVFAGSYSDPNHPGCARLVVLDGEGAGGAMVSGEDGDEGSEDCANPVPWGPLDAVIDGDSIEIDFSPKGGPSDLTASYDLDRDGILFSDGNLWAKLE
jgi:hypothetical protein